jgi:hypothetical protein
MNTTPLLTPSSPLTLRSGAVLTLARPHDGCTRVLVESGRVWLTQSGDADDHFIAAGEDLLLCGSGEVVIECDSAEAARVRIWHGAPAVYPVNAVSSVRPAPPAPSASAGRFAAGHTG